MLNPEQLVGTVVDQRETTYRIEDTILYALGLGYGSDPLAPDQLQFVYEEGLKAVPTLALVLGYPGFWMKDPRYQIDWARVLHAEEHVTIHRPLPVAATVTGTTSVDEIADRGAAKGAFVYVRKEVHDKATGDLLATVISNTLARGDGGFGGPAPSRPKPKPLPERAPDHVCDLPTLPQQALIYRLCGDLNPLHADPAIATRAGFERPILHGRCTMGFALRAVMQSCGDDPDGVAAMSVRFSAPFLPGETLRTEIWEEPDRLAFRSSCVERDITVLNNGEVQLRAAG